MAFRSGGHRPGSLTAAALLGAALLLPLATGPAAASPLGVFLADPSYFAPASPRDRAFWTVAALEDPLALTGAKVYPNPFDPFTTDAVIAFTLSEDAEVTITAYDWNGEYVDTVFKGSLSAGANAVDWGGQTEDGRKLGNGVYLLRIVAAVSARQEDAVLKVAVWND
jgi:FlgD Ig-like domain